MTKLFLAAGVAALAIATPAAAKPGGGHGGNPHGAHGGGAPQAQQHGNGGQGGGQAARGGGGGHGGGQAFRGGGGGHGGGGRMQEQAFQRHGGGHSAAPRRQPQAFVQQHGGGHGGGHGAMRQMQAQRQQAHGKQVRQAQNRGHQQQIRRNEMRQAQNRGHQQQLRGNAMREARNHGFERQQMKANRVQQAQTRNFQPREIHGKQLERFQQRALQQQAFNQNFGGKNFGRGNGFAPQEAQLLRNRQQAYRQELSNTRFAALNWGYGDRTPILAPTVVQQFIGVPVGNVASFASLSPLPASIGYLYPATPNYYYRYGDGYLYQVDRGSNLISALMPLLAGGYLPGQYLPQPYMASYVPDYYGFDAFYPDYGDTCNRYANGVIYEVDCYSGMVEDVIPLYASGYGVGQILPTTYNYYNVPYQYRDVYYDTPDYNYWYSPGAIYQYDPRSSMITSVAALLSPGFTVGQPLPVGYDVYNVPYSYRATYYDTPNAWYRYNNGYIYQVDPVTRLVTAIVASILT